MTKIVTSFTTITTTFLLIAIAPSVEAISSPNQRGPSPDDDKKTVEKEVDDQEKIERDEKAFDPDFRKTTLVVGCSKYILRNFLLDDKM